MKKLIVISLVTAFVLLGGSFLACAQQTYTTSNYFPLLSGQSWTYSVSDGTNITDTVQEGAVMINGSETKLLQSSNGEQIYLTNDSNGIREHMELVPAGLYPSGTLTFSPPFKHAEAEMELGQSVYSSGTAYYYISGIGIFPLSYTGTSTFEASESVTVPKGTFDTGRLWIRVTCTGSIGMTPVNITVNQYIWVAQNLGVVKQIANSKTYELTDTNFTPYPFSFTAQIGVPLQTMIVSNPITVSGISAPALISVDGGEYNIDGGSYTSITGTVNNGQTVTIRLTSSNIPGTQQPLR